MIPTAKLKGRIDPLTVVRLPDARHEVSAREGDLYQGERRRSPSGRDLSYDRAYLAVRPGPGAAGPSSPRHPRLLAASGP